MWIVFPFDIWRSKSLRSVSLNSGLETPFIFGIHPRSRKGSAESRAFSPRLPSCSIPTSFSVSLFRSLVLCRMDSGPSRGAIAAVSPSPGPTTWWWFWRSTACWSDLVLCRHGCPTWLHTLAVLPAACPPPPTPPPESPGANLLENRIPTLHLYLVCICLKDL